MTARAVCLTLTDDQLSRLAELVAERLATRAGVTTARLVDAAELATLLKISRDAVYRNAIALGGQRIGNGERGRLRFDIETALARWNAKPADTPSPAVPRRRVARPNGVKLLPIRGER